MLEDIKRRANPNTAPQNDDETLGDFYNGVKQARREYRDEVEPNRLNYTKAQLERNGYKVTIADDTKLIIFHNGHRIQFYPFTGWFTGKGIKDGRGIKNLLKQLTVNKNG